MGMLSGDLNVYYSYEELKEIMGYDNDYRKLGK